MKKTKLLLVAIATLPLLASCQKGDDPKDHSLKATLTRLQNGYEASALVTTKYSVASSEDALTLYGYENIYASKGRYRHSYYATSDTKATKDTLESDTTLVDNEGKVALTRLTLENKIETINVTDSSNKTVDWSASNLENAFSSLKEEDFEGENGNYKLKQYTVTKIKDALGVQFYGYTKNSKISLDSLSLSYNEKNVLTFKASLKTYSVTYSSNKLNVDQTYEGEFVALSKEVDLPTPIAKEEDATFKTAFDKLAALNFNSEVTIKTNAYQSGPWKFREKISAAVRPDQFSYAVKGEDDSIKKQYLYFANSDDKIQKALKFGGEYYASRKPKSAAIENYWPTFKISSAFFNLNNGVYELNKDYSSYFTSISLFTPFMDEINTTIESLSIAIKDDSLTITITNSGNSEKGILALQEEIVYRDFGNANQVDTSKVKYDSSSLSWKDALTETEYSQFLKVIGGESMLEKVPFLGGTNCEVAYQTTGKMIYTATETLEEAEEIENRYFEKLPGLGFTKKEIEGYTEFSYSYTASDGGKATLKIIPYAFEIEDSSGNGTGAYRFALYFETM